jgi:hypothetical protein
MSSVLQLHPGQVFYHSRPRRLSDSFPGAPWNGEYGDPSVPGDFDFMYPLSPVHNVPKGRVLPATLLMVSRGQRFLCVLIIITLTFLGISR